MRFANKARLLQINFVYLCLTLCACGGGTSAAPGNSGTGTTPPPTGSEILYASGTDNQLFSFTIDQTTGALTQAGSVSPGGNTVDNSSIVIAPSGAFLYAANDADSGINGYSTNASGALSLLTGSPFPIPQPAGGVGGIVIDSSNRFLYAGSEFNFGIVGFTIDDTSGALTAIPGSPFLTAVGNPPSDIAIDPSGSFLFACSGTDDALEPGHNVWAFTIDSQTGALTPIAGSPFATVENGQPSALRVDPSGHFLYVALYNVNGVAAFAIDSANGSLAAVPGSPFTTASIPFTQASALATDPSGKFLYVFNFNGSTIAAFTIDSSGGALSPVTGSPFATSPAGEGELIVDPSGKFLYLAHGFGPPAAFIILNIDPTTGALTPNPSSPFDGSQEPLGLAVAQFH
jgi:6-phosphogluconolactonase (cycloisomerase 2 family)